MSSLRKNTMTFTTRSITTDAATAAFAACVLTAAPRAAAQGHIQECGEYVLRASTPGGR
jgi:hypothetical protein